MKTDFRNLTVSVLTLAVQGALAAMVVIPATVLAEGSDDVAALTNPTNSLEVGAEYVSNTSSKFGEYNGLDKAGTYLLGDVDVRGGDAYGEGTGTTRWAITGTDLGTTSRNVGASLSNQGSWSLGIGYDQLQHNITDTYQTPYQGTMGGNSFILPPAFGVIDNKDKPNPVAGVIPPYGAQALTLNQQSYFHNEDVNSTRENSSFNAGYNFNPQWDVKFDFNRLLQSGAKLISAGSDAVNTNGLLNVRGEGIVMLMNPTDFRTDTYNLALNWMGDKGSFTGSYYLSQFTDAYNGLNFSNPYVALNGSTGNNVTGTNPGTAFPMDQLGTNPNNNFQQLNLNGGYNLTQTMKLAGGYSYGRNTQNEAYTDQYMTAPGGLPVTSLNGVVVSQHADLKLTDRTTKDLTLSGGVNFNERDNQTASNVYQFYNIDGPPQEQGVINIPESYRRTKADLEGDYRISSSQNVRLGYEYEQIDRWCDNPPSITEIMGALTASGAYSAAQLADARAYYAGGVSCVQVPNSKDNKALANYRFKVSDAVTLNAGYTYSDRRAQVDNSFYSPLQGNSQGFENAGFVAYFDGSRTEQLGKAGVVWQASDKLSLGLTGRYTDDNYDSTLGVQNGDSWSANLDATYSLAEKSTISAYATYQDRKRNLRTAQGSDVIPTVPEVNFWTNNLTDASTTVGLNAKQGGLFGGRVNLAADLTYSLDKTGYSTTLDYVTAACTAPSTSGYNCGALPDISSELWQLKLTGDYKLDKSSKIMAGYVYQHLNSNDYYYDAYQLGDTATGMLPTNQQSPSYTVNVVFVAYNYTWK
ncbi:MAG: MtrB/PioB family decaheme-associated outer membrane protein [Thiobacillaceae bacterium]